MKHMIASVLALLPLAGHAESYENLVQAEFRSGWRLPNGDHMAALQLTLAPGWKTYWRAPGDAGIPPHFIWRGVDPAQVQVEWPAPEIFWQSDMRSVGYEHEVVLPIRIRNLPKGQDKPLKVTMNIGVCKDVCLPHQAVLSTTLPGGKSKPDARIAAAMASLPYSAQEAGVKNVTCRIKPASEGLGLTVKMDMPNRKGREETVIEAPDPQLWIADPKTSWQGGTLVAQTTVRHMSGTAFALDRSALRITVLGGEMVVDIHGCRG
ncbi:MAG: protein-disulfide reductase DsbD family protein [Pelagimonas sp.]|jgi:DsbC/DsbD-like thiol-disulfide interchange protein|nr:protein-disulfide reductase DsbD family protein [Pelagimonas sp.]